MSVNGPVHILQGTGRKVGTGEQVGGEGQVMGKAGEELLQTEREWLGLKLHELVHGRGKNRAEKRIND